MVQVIGRGSFGKVLLARHRPSACLYAMKVLKKAMVVKYDQVRSGGAMGAAFVPRRGSSRAAWRADTLDGRWSTPRLSARC